MKISRDEAVFILGEEKALECQVECEKCEHKNAEFADFKIQLNDIGDLTLSGECAECKEPFTKYIESGADYPSFRRANKVMYSNINRAN